jgi:hypothetical protein
MSRRLGRGRRLKSRGQIPGARRQDLCGAGPRKEGGRSLSVSVSVARLAVCDPCSPASKTTQHINEALLISSKPLRQVLLSRAVHCAAVGGSRFGVSECEKGPALDGLSSSTIRGMA